MVGWLRKTPHTKENEKVSFFFPRIKSKSTGSGPQRQTSADSPRLSFIQKTTKTNQKLPFENMASASHAGKEFYIERTLGKYWGKTEHFRV